jgi:hypothetical protein
MQTMEAAKQKELQRPMKMASMVNGRPYLELMGNGKSLFQGSKFKVQRQNRIADFNVEPGTES